MIAHGGHPVQSGPGGGGAILALCDEGWPICPVGRMGALAGFRAGWSAAPGPERTRFGGLGSGDQSGRSGCRFPNCKFADRGWWWHLVQSGPGGGWGLLPLRWAALSGSVVLPCGLGWPSAGKLPEARPARPALARGAGKGACRVCDCSQGPGGPQGGPLEVHRDRRWSGGVADAQRLDPRGTS